jgi:hypothetical protein
MLREFLIRLCERFQRKPESIRDLTLKQRLLAVHIRSSAPY